MTDPYAPRPIDLPTAVPLEPDADLSVLDEAKILAAPADPGDREAWRLALRRWRTEARARVGYDARRYDDPGTAWASTAWNVAMVWLWDEALRDWDGHRFDADRLLANYADFGGLDAVVLWHAYPVIGIDPRNQFDYYDVPGLAELVADLHERGVKVFVDYNPWDTGTRRPDGSDAQELRGLVDRLGVDGVFLDTLKQGDPELLDALDGLVLEGESRVPLVRVTDHLASWAQWFEDSPTPGVLRARWFEQRHMMHHTRRWNLDHGAELRNAWLNGAGVLIWDVVFGVRVDWSDHDRASLRAMRALYQEFSPLLLEGLWEPLAELAPEATEAGVVASAWRSGERTLFTVVNPVDTAYSGPLVPGLVATVPALGLVAIVADADGAVELRQVSPEAGSKPAIAPDPVRVVPARAAGSVPADAVEPEPGRRTMAERWRQRETGLREAAPYVDDWKPLPPRLHQLRSGEREVELAPVAVDRREVTRAEFTTFVDATGYVPASGHRFLLEGTEDEPVRYVDLDDARAYAAWRGARLPTEDEWQAAAAEPGWHRGEPSVWEWTESEHRDGRTRWVILKGGSWYAAEGSEWYVDGGPHEPDWSLRLLLADAGMSRSPCIGFRCAVDLP